MHILAKANNYKKIITKKSHTHTHTHTHTWIIQGHCFETIESFIRQSPDLLRHITTYNFPMQERSGYRKLLIDRLFRIRPRTNSRTNVRQSSLILFWFQVTKPHMLAWISKEMAKIRQNSAAEPPKVKEVNQNKCVLLCIFLCLCPRAVSF
jgi:hypothetical protein